VRNIGGRKSKKVDYDNQEIEIVKKVLAVGITTPEPVGLIRDKGNTYTIFEYIHSAMDLYKFKSLRV